jgi:hypothetical protein
MSSLLEVLNIWIVVIVQSEDGAVCDLRNTEIVLSNIRRVTDVFYVQFWLFSVNLLWHFSLH